MNNNYDNEPKYKLRFGIKKFKITNGDFSLSIGIARQGLGGKTYETYLYLCLIKWEISIGRMYFRISED